MEKIGWFFWDTSSDGLPNGEMSIFLVDLSPLKDGKRCTDDSVLQWNNLPTLGQKGGQSVREPYDKSL